VGDGQENHQDTEAEQDQVIDILNNPIPLHTIPFFKNIIPDCPADSFLPTVFPENPAKRFIFWHSHLSTNGKRQERLCLSLLFSLGRDASVFYLTESRFRFPLFLSKGCNNTRKTAEIAQIFLYQIIDPLVVNFPVHVDEQIPEFTLFLQIRRQIFGYYTRLTQEGKTFGIVIRDSPESFGAYMVAKGQRCFHGNKQAVAGNVS
jgi:hypothetical protein